MERKIASRRRETSSCLANILVARDISASQTNRQRCRLRALQTETHKLRAGLEKMLGVFNFSGGGTLTVVFTPEYGGLVKELMNLAKNFKIRLEALRIKSARDSAGLRRIREKYIKARSLLLISRESLTHNQLTLEAKRNGARVISMPNISIKTLERSAFFDILKIRNISSIIAGLLENTREIGITSPNGTDVRIYMGNRKVKCDADELRRGSHQNFPSGEVCIAPPENRGSGKIFFDKVSYYKDHRAVFLKNAGLEIKNGKITRTLNRNGKTLYDYISRFRGFNSIAELGIGANPWASFKGPIVEAEKALGTVHIAFGENKTLGGKHKADIHKDGVIFRPTMYFGSKPIIKNGRMVLDEIQEILGS